MTSQNQPPKPPPNTPEEMRYFMDKVRDIMDNEGFDDMILEEIEDGFAVRRKKR